MERKIQGHLDMALNETGRKEVLICLDKIVSLNIDNIISSDLVRAKETAQIIKKILSYPRGFGKFKRIRKTDDLYQSTD